MYLVLQFEILLFKILFSLRLQVDTCTRLLLSSDTHTQYSFPNLHPQPIHGVPGILDLLVYDVHNRE